VNAAFFALAFTAAANPKLLGLDLLLIENRRPRAMFACILAGGLGVAIAIGLIDVLVVKAHAIGGQRSASAAIDLTLGLLLVFLGVLLLTGYLPIRRKSARSAPGNPGGQATQQKQEKEKKENWAVRALREPRLGLAAVIGVLVGLPGAAYLTALDRLSSPSNSTGTQVGGVVVFALIEFVLIIVPWVFLELWPERTASVLKQAQHWLGRHAKQLIAWIALLLGAYLVIEAIVRLALSRRATAPGRPADVSAAGLRRPVNPDRGHGPAAPAGPTLPR
jgi:Sap, sulfolipid-1-addressing protein